MDAPALPAETVKSIAERKEGVHYHVGYIEAQKDVDVDLFATALRSYNDPRLLLIRRSDLEEKARELAQTSKGVMWTMIKSALDNGAGIGLDLILELVRAKLTAMGEKDSTFEEPAEKKGKGGAKGKGAKKATKKEEDVPTGPVEVIPTGFPDRVILLAGFFDNGKELLDHCKFAGVGSGSKAFEDGKVVLSSGFLLKSDKPDQSTVDPEEDAPASVWDVLGQQGAEEITFLTHTIDQLPAIAAPVEVKAETKNKKKAPAKPAKGKGKGKAGKRPTTPEKSEQAAPAEAAEPPVEKARQIWNETVRMYVVYELYGEWIGRASIYNIPVTEPFQQDMQSHYQQLLDQVPNALIDVPLVLHAAVEQIALSHGEPDIVTEGSKDEKKKPPVHQKKTLSHDPSVQTLDDIVNGALAQLGPSPFEKQSQRERLQRKLRDAVTVRAADKFGYPVAVAEAARRGGKVSSGVVRLVKAAHEHMEPLRPAFGFSGASFNFPEEVPLEVAAEHTAMLREILHFSEQPYSDGSLGNRMKAVTMTRTRGEFLLRSKKLVDLIKADEAVEIPRRIYEEHLNEPEFKQAVVEAMELSRSGGQIVVTYDPQTDEVLLGFLPADPSSEPDAWGLEKPLAVPEFADWMSLYDEILDDAVTTYLNKPVLAVVEDDEEKETEAPAENAEAAFVETPAERAERTITSMNLLPPRDTCFYRGKLDKYMRGVTSSGSDALLLVEQSASFFPKDLSSISSVHQTGPGESERVIVRAERREGTYVFQYNVPKLAKTPEGKEEVETVEEGEQNAEEEAEVKKETEEVKEETEPAIADVAEGGAREALTTPGHFSAQLVDGARFALDGKTATYCTCGGLAVCVGQDGTVTLTHPRVNGKPPSGELSRTLSLKGRVVRSLEPGMEMRVSEELFFDGRVEVVYPDKRAITHPDGRKETVDADGKSQELPKIEAALLHDDAFDVDIISRADTAAVITGKLFSVAEHVDGTRIMGRAKQEGVPPAEFTFECPGLPPVRCDAQEHGWETQVYLPLGQKLVVRGSSDAEEPLSGVLEIMGDTSLTFAVGGKVSVKSAEEMGALYEFDLGRGIMTARETGKDATDYIVDIAGSVFVERKEPPPKSDVESDGSESVADRPVGVFPFDEAPGSDKPLGARLFRAKRNGGATELLNREEVEPWLSAMQNQQDAGCLSVVLQRMGPARGIRPSFSRPVSKAADTPAPAKRGGSETPPDNAVKDRFMLFMADGQPLKFAGISRLVKDDAIFNYFLADVNRMLPEAFRRHDGVSMDSKKAGLGASPYLTPGVLQVRQLIQRTPVELYEIHHVENALASHRQWAEELDQENEFSQVPDSRSEEEKLAEEEVQNLLLQELESRQKEQDAAEEAARAAAVKAQAETVPALAVRKAKTPDEAEEEAVRGAGQKPKQKEEVKGSEYYKEYPLPSYREANYFQSQEGQAWLEDPKKLNDMLSTYQLEAQRFGEVGRRCGPVPESGPKESLVNKVRLAATAEELPQVLSDTVASPGQVAAAEEAGGALPEDYEYGPQDGEGSSQFPPPPGQAYIDAGIYSGPPPPAPAESADVDLDMSGHYAPEPRGGPDSMEPTVPGAERTALVDIYGRPRDPSTLNMPDSIRENRERLGVAPNYSYLARESGSMRQVKTSSVQLAKQRGVEQRCFHIVPSQLDFGNIMVGCSIKANLQIQNIGANPSRFRFLRNQNPNIQLEYNPRAIAPGMKINVAVRVFAAHPGPMSETLELLSEVENISVPVYAHVYSAAEGEKPEPGDLPKGAVMESQEFKEPAAQVAPSPVSMMVRPPDTPTFDDEWKSADNVNIDEIRRRKIQGTPTQNNPISHTDSINQRFA